MVDGFRLASRANETVRDLPEMLDDPLRSRSTLSQPVD
jgi:hypothetical protein